MKDGQQYPFDEWARDMKRRFRPAQGPSEGAPHESTGPAKVVAAVPTGSLPVPASEILRVASALEDNALTRDAIAGDGLALTDMQQQCRTEAIALRYCANVLKRHSEYLRRQVEHSTERQPEENPSISRER